MDFDQGLNKAINRLRAALGDSAENPRFIETFPRRGYRLICPLVDANQAKSADTAPESLQIRLAILPLENLSGDPSQEYFSDGMTEELITQLGGLCPARLGVIARTSVNKLKKSDKTIHEIGRELGVDYMVEGTRLSIGSTRPMTSATAIYPRLEFCPRMRLCAPTRAFSLSWTESVCRTRNSVTGAFLILSWTCNLIAG